MADKETRIQLISNLMIKMGIYSSFFHITSSYFLILSSPSFILCFLHPPTLFLHPCISPPHLSSKEIAESHEGMFLPMTKLGTVVTLLKAEKIFLTNQLPPALAGGKNEPLSPPALAKHNPQSYIILFCFG